MDEAAGRAAPHLLEPLKSASYSSPSPRVKRTHAANQMKSVQRANGSLAQSGARPQCGFHLLDSGKSSLYPSVLCRVKRTHIANQMKRVQRANGSLAQSGARPLCGLRLLDSGKSSLYPRGPRRVKRTHIANQMKRVQRVEDSLAQSGARPQCGFHLLPQRTPRGKHGKADMLAQKRSCAAPPTPFPVPRRDRRQKTHNPGVNQPSPITTRHPRTRYWRSRPMAE